MSFNTIVFVACHVCSDVIRLIHAYYVLVEASVTKC